MALSRLTCPECNSVLRPAKPVAEGKKIKCPKCQTIFVAGEVEDEEVEPVEEDSDERPRKATARKKAAAPPPRKKAAPAVKEPPPKKKDDEEEETYGYIKEDDDERPPEIDYAPDMSIKDLRGPAIVKLLQPATYLQLAGFIGFLGWFVLLVMIVIPIVFPVEGASDKPRPVMPLGPGLSAVNPAGGGGFGGGMGMMMPPAAAGGGGGTSGVKYEEEKGAGFFDVFGIDLVAFFLPLLPVFLLGLVWTGLVVGGSIKMQNLESKVWSYVGAIMVMVPFHVLGLYALLSILLRYGLGMIIDDMDYLNSLANGGSALAYVACLGIGIWCLIVLKDKDVVAGFEYKAE